MTPIVNLLFWRGPAAIAGFVISVVIWPSVDCFPSGTFAHIGEEIFESEPAFANGNAAPAIVFEPSVFGIGTSLFHDVPSAISRRIFGGVAVLELQVMAIASAAGCFASRQITSVGGYLISAITSALPKSLSCGGCDGEASKTLTEVWHG
jgi:hypothetical protein